MQINNLVILNEVGTSRRKFFRAAEGTPAHKQAAGGRGPSTHKFARAERTYSVLDDKFLGFSTQTGSDRYAVIVGAVSAFCSGRRKL
jgi:hypothetical protein